MAIIFWLCLGGAIAGLIIGPHWWFAMKRPVRVRIRSGARDPAEKAR